MWSAYIIWYHYRTCANSASLCFSLATICNRSSTSLDASTKQAEIFVDPGEKDDLPEVFDGENVGFPCLLSPLFFALIFVLRGLGVALALVHLVRRPTCVSSLS